MMVSKEKNALHGKFGPAGYTFGGDSGSTRTGFIENAVATPYGGPAVAAS